MSLIYGKNAVIEAINSDKTINKIYAYGKSKEIYDIIKKAKDKKIVVVESDKNKLDAMIEGKNSQGVVASVTEYKYCDINDIILEANRKGEEPFVLILDKIEDPHNLGAIIRSCECMGVHGIIIPKRNSCLVTDTVEKVAVGACSFVKIARVSNISESIKYLKKVGFWVYGLDMKGQTSLYQTAFGGSVALVIGNEGKGISELVKKNCDMLVNIPMKGKINSLNASVSAAISIYEVNRKRFIQ